MEKNEWGIKVKSTTYPEHPLQHNEWMIEFNVSRSYQEIDKCILNAKELMGQFDYSKYKYKFNVINEY